MATLRAHQLPKVLTFRFAPRIYAAASATPGNSHRPPRQKEKVNGFRDLSTSHAAGSPLLWLPNILTSNKDPGSPQMGRRAAEAPEYSHRRAIWVRWRPFSPSRILGSSGAVNANLLPNFLTSDLGIAKKRLLKCLTVCISRSVQTPNHAAPQYPPEKAHL
jgi:hypothetical protein